MNTNKLFLIPIDIWVKHIFIYCELKDLKNIRITSKIFNDIIDNSLKPLWVVGDNYFQLDYIVSYQSYSKFHNIKLCGKFINNKKNVETILKLLPSNCHHMILNYFNLKNKRKLDYLPCKLQMLEIEYFNNIDRLFPFPETLTFLKLYECKLKYFTFQKLYNLTNLHLSFCYGQINQCFKCPVSNITFLPKLLNLSIKNCQGINESIFNYLPINLSNLGIFDCFDITENFVGLLNRFNNLKHLILYIIQTESFTISKKSLNYLPTTLSKLHIDYHNLTDDMILNLPSKLITLDLINCTKITTKILNSLPKTIENLYLPKDIFDPNTYVPYNYFYLRNLVYLNISNSHIQNFDLQYLPKKLKYLILENSPYITDSGFINFPCSNLILLNLSYCKLITSKIFKYIPISLNYLYLKSYEPNFSIFYQYEISNKPLLQIFT